MKQTRNLKCIFVFVLLNKLGPCVLAESDLALSDEEFCFKGENNFCKDAKPCLKYDEEKFKTSPSIFTDFPEGRLGNRITAFLILLFMKLEFGHDVYYEKESFDDLYYYFENVKSRVKILEEELCDWKEFGFVKYEGNIERLGEPQFLKGRAIQIFLDRKNFMRHEVQGGQKYIKKYRKELLHALTFRQRFADHAVKTLQEVAAKIGKKTSEVTFVSIHNRRTDYLAFRKRRLGLKNNIYKNYFYDAMDYFNNEYDNVVFLYTSDDMEWAYKKLKKFNNLFFVGCGDGEDKECVGKDFAVLCACNHTITTQGSFGTWASIIAGGEIYTEYGSIVP